jgi:hypothetical protein
MTTEQQFKNQRFLTLESYHRIRTNYFRLSQELLPH